MLTISVLRCKVTIFFRNVQVPGEIFLADLANIVYMAYLESQVRGRIWGTSRLWPSNRASAAVRKAAARGSELV